jgi:MFS family permease
MRMVGEVANKERAFGVRLLTELVIVATLLYFLPLLIASKSIAGGIALLVVAVLVMSLSALVIPKGAETVTTDNAADRSAIDRLAWVALAIFVLFACGQVALWVFIERIGRSIEVGASDMGLVFAALKVVGGLSAALVALLGDRLGNRWPHVLVLLFLTLGVLMLANPVNFWIYAFGAWIWEGAFTIGCVYQTAAIAKLDQSNRLVVLVPAAFAVSAFIGPELAGRLAEAGGFTPLFVLAVVCAAIPTIAFWNVDRRPAHG